MDCSQVPNLNSEASFKSFEDESKVNSQVTVCATQVKVWKQQGAAYEVVMSYQGDESS